MSAALERAGRWIDAIAYGAGYVAGLVLLAIILLTMAEVVSRYGFRNPLILSDEFGGYALVAISFLGLAFCARESGHIRITFLVERLRPALAGRIRLVTLTVMLVFIAVAAWVSWKFVGDSFTRNMRSNSLLMVPLKWPQMAIPIGFTLFALVLLARLVRAIGDWRSGQVVDRFSTEEF